MVEKSDDLGVPRPDDSSEYYDSEYESEQDENDEG